MTTPIDQLASLAPDLGAVARRAAGASVRAGFEHLLDKARSAEQNTTPSEARTTAQQLVATTFIVPILRQMRESSHAPAPWGPTTAEKNFGPMLDAKIADQIVSASDMPIVERITNTILRNTGQPVPTTATHSGPFNLRENSHG